LGGERYAIPLGSKKGGRRGADPFNLRQAGGGEKKDEKEWARNGGNRKGVVAEGRSSLRQPTSEEKYRSQPGQFTVLAGTQEGGDGEGKLSNLQK